MINQLVTLKAPIKIIQSKNYYLVIEDSEGISHYFHNESEEFKQGQYDGWSKDCRWIGNKVKCDLCSHEWIAVFPEYLDKIECPNCHNMINFEIICDSQ